MVVAVMVIVCGRHCRTPIWLVPTWLHQST